MKTIENIFLKGCGYTLAILFSFYILGILTDTNAPYIDFLRFAVFFAFGMLVSVCGFILKLDSVKPWLRVLLHYAALLATFLIMFVAFGNISGVNVFSSIVLFTFLYVIIFCAVYFISKAVKNADKRIDARKRKSVEAKAKKKYNPLYRKED